jgi:predicted cytidylate kinase
MTTITISGTPGSGKSTVAQLLQKKLNLSYVYSGMLFRNLADSYKMSLEEFGKFCEQHNQVDRQLDDQQVEILKVGDVILEGRLSGWLAYKNGVNAIKIMIDADEDTRAARIVNREGGTINERKAEIRKREKSERKRYLQYYQFDLLDTSIYDVVIDSSKKSPEEIVELIESLLNKNR